MKKAPVLETQRLCLRKPRAADIPRIVQFADNEKIYEMTMNMPHPYNEEAAIAWINMANEGLKDDSHFIFAIAQKPDDELIGGIGLKVNNRFNRAELGFWLGEPFWNSGFMSEATRAIIRFGFEELDLHKIFAHHMTKNPASGQVMKKNGMRKEGLLEDHVLKDDTHQSLVVYGITKSAFQAQQG